MSDTAAAAGAFATAHRELQLTDSDGKSATAPDSLINPGGDARTKLLNELTKLVHHTLGSADLRAADVHFTQPSGGILRAIVEIVTDDAESLDSASVAPGLGKLHNQVDAVLAGYVANETDGLTARGVPGAGRIALEPIGLHAAVTSASSSSSPPKLSTLQHATVWSVAIVGLLALAVVVNLVTDVVDLSGIGL